MDATFGNRPSEPTPGTDPFLRVLVLQQGRAVACSASAELRLFGGAYFVVSRPDGAVSEPYADLPALFSSLGRAVAVGAGVRVLEWDGLVLSQDADGLVGGPYAGFDEWVWSEADTVSREEGPTGRCMSWGGRYIHHWRGLYFVTVDPLPAWQLSFPTLDGARDELLNLSFLATRLLDG